MRRKFKNGALGYAAGGAYQPPPPSQLLPAPLSPDAPTSQLRGTELSNDQYLNYGYGPEHNFFPGQRDFGPMHPIVEGNPQFTIPTSNGQPHPSWVDQALGLAGIVKTGKNLYDMGRDAYNYYQTGNTAGAQTFDDWVAKNDPDYQNRTQQEMQNDYNSYMDSLDLGLGAAGAVAGWNASNATPGGNVTISDPDAGQTGGSSGGGSGGGGPGGYSGAGAAVGSGAALGNLGSSLAAPAGSVTISGVDGAAEYGAEQGAQYGADAAGAGSNAGSGFGSSAGVLGDALAIYGAYKGIDGLGAAYRQGDVKNGMIQGATAGASVGSVIPVIGTVAGGIIGGALGTLYTGASNHTTESNTQKSAWSQFAKSPENTTFRGSAFPLTAAFDGAMRTDNDKDPALLKAIGDQRGQGYPSSAYAQSWLKNQIRQAQASGQLPPDSQLKGVDGASYFDKVLTPLIYGPNGGPRNDKIKRLMETMTDDLFYNGVGKETDGSESQAWYHTDPSSNSTTFDEAASRAASAAKQHARGGLARFAMGGQVGMIPRRGGLSAVAPTAPPENPNTYYRYGAPQRQLPPPQASPMPMGGPPAMRPPVQLPVRPGMPMARASGGLTAAMHAAQSKRPPRLVRGPGTGRSDDIPAVLSDGEYVMDAETVALLGDGSTDEGARRLDKLREKLRMHKGKQLAKGKFSSKAKQPDEYLE